MCPLTHRNKISRGGEAMSKRWCVILTVEVDRYTDNKLPPEKPI